MSNLSPLPGIEKLGFDGEQIYARLNDVSDKKFIVATEKAKAEAEFHRLDNLKKTVCSKLKVTHSEVAPGEKPMSDARSETLAFADPLYEEFINDLARAEERYRILDAEYWRLNEELNAIQLFVEVFKSQSYSDKRVYDNGDLVP